MRPGLTPNGFLQPRIHPKGYGNILACLCNVNSNVTGAITRLHVSQEDHWVLLFLPIEEQLGCFEAVAQIQRLKKRGFVNDTFCMLLWSTC